MVFKFSSYVDPGVYSTIIEQPKKTSPSLGDLVKFKFEDKYVVGLFIDDEINYKQYTDLRIAEYRFRVLSDYIKTYFVQFSNFDILFVTKEYITKYLFRIL